MYFYTIALLLSALDYITATNYAETEIPVQPLFIRFQKAMSVAQRHMRLMDQAYPVVYDYGGGCYTGYGALSLTQCRSAISKMPSQHPSVDDITEGMIGPVLTRNFYQERPLVWRSDDCLIGVSVMDAPRAKGLYPLFREAAQLILDRCVVRARGGLVRFAHFEVVLFDARTLPGYGQRDFIRDFAVQEDNIPFSTGLVRIDQNRGAIQQGFDVGDV
ncbi:hypothetical protein MMC34_000592 [Xylographa carneopallida]|nr:hypothetical protein [Xylographa carneopallida]